MAAHHKILCFLLVPGWELHRGGRVGCQVAEKSWKQLQVTHRALSWDWRIAESLETAGKTGELRAFLLLSLQQDPFAPWCLTLQLLQRWLEKLLNRYHSQNTSCLLHPLPGAQTSVGPHDDTLWGSQKQPQQRDERQVLPCPRTRPWLPALELAVNSFQIPIIAMGDTKIEKHS